MKGKSLRIDMGLVEGVQKLSQILDANYDINAENS